MERFQLDASQAFSVLRRYPQVHSVKLRAVAEDLVNTGQLPAGAVALDARRSSQQ